MDKWEALDRRVELALECPIDWSAETGGGSIDTLLLQFDWLDQLAQWDVMREAISLSEAKRSGRKIENVGSYEETVAEIINVEAARPNASLRYQTSAGALSGLTFLTPSAQGKHFYFGADQSEVISRSKSGPSQFFADFTAPELRGSFWLWLSEVFPAPNSAWDYYDIRSDYDSDKDVPAWFRNWRDLLFSHSSRYVMNTNTPIGSDKGIVTSYVVFDVHISSKMVHAYPVSENEARSIGKAFGEIYEDPLLPDAMADRFSFR